jgi:hypothetical protein
VEIEILKKGNEEAEENLVCCPPFLMAGLSLD